MKKACLGFTLIELLVAVSVMGIVFSVGVAQYQEFNRRQIVLQAAQDLKSDLRLAQDKALAGEKPSGCVTLEGYRLSFTSEKNYKIEAVCSGGVTSEVKSVDLSGNVTGPSGEWVLFKVLAQGVENPGDFYLSGYGRWVEKVAVEAAGNIYREVAEALPTPTPSKPTPTPTPIITPTPTPSPTYIFADGFESGDLSAWDYSTGGALSASTAARYTGDYGMQAYITGSPTIYVRDNFTSTSEYYARVYINPNGISLPSGWNKEVMFLRLSDVGTNWFLCEVGIKANSTSGYDIRMIGQNDVGSWDLTSEYLNITDGWHLIEIIWRAASCGGCNDGYSELIIDGVSRYTKSDRDNDTHAADRAVLGAVRNISGPGTIYFDDFYSAYTP